MHAQQVDAVLVHEVHDPVEMAGVLEADAHLHGEKPGHGGAQRGEDFADAPGLAQQAATDVFLVNLGRRAAEVEVDAGHAVAEQFSGGALQVFEILADQLGEDGAAGLILVDGAEDVLLRARLGMDPEELGEEIVGRAVAGDDAHEGEVGHVLHRRERGEGAAGLLAGRQHAGGAGRGGGEGKPSVYSSVDSGSAPSSACCLSTRSRMSVLSSTAS